MSYFVKQNYNPGSREGEREASAQEKMRQAGLAAKKPMSGKDKDAHQKMMNDAQEREAKHKAFMKSLREKRKLLAKKM